MSLFTRCIESWEEWGDQADSSPTHPLNGSYDPTEWMHMVLGFRSLISNCLGH